MKGSKSKPPPSFRIDSGVIFESESRYFIDQLDNIEEPEGWPRFVPYDDRMDTDDAFSDSNMGGHSPITALRSESSGSDAIRPAGIPKKWAQKAPPGIQYELYGTYPYAQCTPSNFGRTGSMLILQFAHLLTIQ